MKKIRPLSAPVPRISPLTSERVYLESISCLRFPAHQIHDSTIMHLLFFFLFAAYITLHNAPAPHFVICGVESSFQRQTFSTDNEWLEWRNNDHMLQ